MLIQGETNTKENIMKEEINICLSTDDDYIQHTATVVASILSNAQKKDSYHFYILSTRLSDENKKKFNEITKIKNCEIDYPKLDEKILDPFKSVKMHSHLTLETFNRLLIPKLFPKLSKMIYIDSDLVVLSDIADINKIDVSGYYFAGVKDANSKELVRRHGYDQKYEYINAGVIIINCDELRRCNYFSTILEQIGKIEARTGDQDFINYCFHEKIKVISYKWNMYHKFHFETYGGKQPTDDNDYVASIKNPVIVHFVGPDKPWNIDSLHPYKKAYLKYLKMTPWAENSKKYIATDFVSDRGLYPSGTGIISLGCNEEIQGYLNEEKLYNIAKDNYMPFDNCYSSLTGINSVLKNNFNNIWHNMCFDDKRGYFVNEALGLFYNKDRDCGNDFDQFKRRLDERIAHFKIALLSKKHLFFVLKAYSNPQAVNELYQILKLKRGKLPFSLIVIDQRNKLKGLNSNIIHCGITSPYKDDTGWCNPDLNKTKEAAQYKSDVLDFIKKEINYCITINSNKIYVNIANSKERRTYLSFFGIKVISYHCKNDSDNNSKKSVLRLFSIPVFSVKNSFESKIFWFVGIRIFSLKERGIYRIVKFLGIPFCFWKIQYTSTAQLPRNIAAIRKLKNKYKGHRCFIVGGSPSLNQLDLTKLNNEYTCTVGKGYKLVEKGLQHSTFHVFGDIFGYAETCVELDVNFSEIYFFRSAIDCVNPIKNKIFFDTYEGGHQSAAHGCQTNMEKPLFCGKTVVVYALQIMAYLGFSEIIFIGVDLDFRKIDSHAYASTKQEQKRESWSVSNQNIMWNALNFCCKFLIEKKKIKILNASPVGNMDFIPRIDFNNLFSKNSERLPHTPKTSMLVNSQRVPQDSRSSGGKTIHRSRTSPNEATHVAEKSRLEQPSPVDTDVPASQCLADKHEILKPAYHKKNIPVVFSADNNYAPYLAVTIQSLIKNSSGNFNYDIVILERDMSDVNKNLIQSIPKKRNISVRFTNVSRLLAGCKFHINTYFSEETYYRLFIPTIFANYSKVIYLDCDIIILRDIADLYQVDLSKKLLAATYNISTYIHQKYDKPVKNVPWRKYLTEVLNLSKPENYFQAGVLVFNVSKMKEYNIQERAIRMAESFEPVLVDQDILNSICQNNVFYFSQKWNLHNNFSVQYKNMKTLSELPKPLVDDYLSAKSCAYIIHYAGKEKPWSHPSLEYANSWWQYARQTPFYEEIIYRIFSNSVTQLKHDTPSLSVIKEAFNYRKNCVKYLQYKLLTKLSWGEKHYTYKQIKNTYKDRIKRVRSFLKENI